MTQIGQMTVTNRPVYSLISTIQIPRSTQDQSITLLETNVMKSLFALCAVMGLMMITSTASAQTSPEDVAARCVNKINGIVDRCQSAAADETEECVRTIRRLLADGRERAARRVAKQCIRSATERTENCADRVIASVMPVSTHLLL